MRFNPDRCPVCGELPDATCDMVPGNALLYQDEDGEFEYEGETKMCWDGQITPRDGEGHVEVICDNGHMWYAEMDEGA